MASFGSDREASTPQVVGDGSLPNPATIADTKLKPMSQDEIILGFQKALTAGWSLGTKVTHRKVNNGMDDYCGHQAFGSGRLTTSTPTSTAAPWRSASCSIPGNDVNLKIDVNNDGNLKSVTVPAKYLGLEKYSRVYTGLELTLDRPFNGQWGFNASYTLSRTKGTAEGYVNSVINQEDAGVTQDFDFGSLTDGSNGYLANDRRHVFKAYGNYALTPEVRVGFNATVSSGRPLNCIGFVPESVPDYADAGNYSTASSYYCLGTDGKSHLIQRGTWAGWRGAAPSTCNWPTCRP